ncbi:MAG: HYR domain-containing protein [Saprospiraceae bacterium]
MLSQAVNWTVPTASDNCGIDTLFSDIQPGANLDIGLKIVTYYARDLSGNETGCSFAIDILDTIAPVVNNCPMDITVNGDPDSCYQIVNWTNPDFLDNCVLDNTTFSHMPGDTFPIGTTNVSITGIDQSGNESTCSFNVTVEDTSTPVLSNCPVDFTVLADPDSCSRTVFWNAPIISGGCAGAITLDVNVPSGTSLDVGQHLIVYTATSTNGNSANCTFVITVEDPVGPMFIDCPSDITLNSEPGLCGAPATWTLPTVDPSCGMDTLIFNFEPGDTFPVGTTEVLYIAYGMTGDPDTCSFNVTVIDIEEPVVSNCPSNITVFAQANTCEGIATWTAPTASDNCQVTSFTSNFMSGDTFSLGTTTVFYMATDANNNTTVCSFDVIVRDTVAPQISLCPASVEVYTDGTIISDPDDLIFIANGRNCEAVQLFYIPPAATDNCGSATVLQVPVDPLVSGDTFPVGITDINFFAEDNAGNVSFCNLTITVVGVKDLAATASQDTLCAGGNVQLSAFSAVANVSYQWTGPNGFISNQPDTLLSNLSPAASGTYTVVSTTPGGCTDTVSLDIVVNPNPDITIIHTDVSCTNGTDDLVLSYTDAAGTNIANWNWDGPNSFSSNIQSPVIPDVTPLNSGQYNLEVTTAEGCTDTTSIVIIIGITPSLTSLTATDNDTSLCINEMTTLTGSLLAVSILYTIGSKSLPE